MDPHNRVCTRESAQWNPRNGIRTTESLRCDIYDDLDSHNDYDGYDSYCGTTAMTATTATTATRATV